MDDDEIIMAEDEEEEKKISYIDSQLNYYIDKLDPKNKFNNIVKPNSTDGDKWTSYLNNVKLYSDEMKHKAEWIYVSALFDQTNFVFQHAIKNKNDLDEKAQKKYIKQALESSISAKSTTQKGRYKQVYDHMIDLVGRFESHKIPIDVWLPLLSQICISFRFLHDSNFKRKKSYKLYDNFISAFISNCLELISNKEVE
ncbi:1237_t:CDS:1 [Racocetra fulgida]|uniref:1237_t:CDS:1 n=1 Tax=Racocetra fulgida TaxID=60492 RepID=A0A9N9FRI7_9GLOM|nr:1237_t:CDS:1 [Racocetra fulgida]